MSNTPGKRQRWRGPGPIGRRKQPFTKVVSADVLRKLFEDNDILGKVVRGELLAIPSVTPPDPLRRLPPGTVTHYITYTTLGGRPVAQAHRYILPPPDKSTPPDPKMVVDGLVTYFVEF